MMTIKPASLFALILLGALIAVGTFTNLGTATWQTLSSGDPQETPPHLSQESGLSNLQSDAHAGQGAYTNWDYNFSMKFPEGWEIKNSQIPGTVVKAVHRDPNGLIAIISVNVQPCGDLGNFDIWEFNEQELFKTFISTYPDASIDLVRGDKAVVAGQHARWLEFDVKSPPDATLLGKSYFLIGGSAIIGIRGFINERNHAHFEAFMPKFESAVRSFRFIAGDKKSSPSATQPEALNSDSGATTLDSKIKIGASFTKLLGGSIKGHDLVKIIEMNNLKTFIENREGKTLDQLSNLELCQILDELGVPAIVPEHNDQDPIDTSRLGAEKGNVSAQYNLAILLATRNNGARDQVEAFDWCKKSAEAGHMDAQFTLAKWLEKGYGIGKDWDYKEVAIWMQKAADQGHHEAEECLGSFFHNGIGVSKNQALGVEWWRKAAEAGIAKAQLRLGLCYDRNEGVQKDKAEAVRWFHKAAAQGNMTAQSYLADRYYKGEGVEKNLEEAALWYRRAAEQGDAKCQKELGGLYIRGEGVALDHSKASEWILRAANQGLESAMLVIGARYSEGSGVPQNLLEAHAWMNVCAGRAHETQREMAILLRNDCEKKMTREQIARAQERAREIDGSIKKCSPE